MTFKEALNINLTSLMEIKLGNSTEASKIASVNVKT